MFCLLIFGKLLSLCGGLALYKHSSSESVVISVVFGRCGEFFRQNSMLARCRRIRVES